jgi:hypothetical protein
MDINILPEKEKNPLKKDIFKDIFNKGETSESQKIAAEKAGDRKKVVDPKELSGEKVPKNIISNQAIDPHKGLEAVKELVNVLETKGIIESAACQSLSPNNGWERREGFDYYLNSYFDHWGFGKVQLAFKFTQATNAYFSAEELVITANEKGVIMEYKGECCNYGGLNIPNETSLEKATSAIETLKSKGVIPKNTEFDIMSEDGNRTFQITPKL